VTRRAFSIIATTRAVIMRCEKACDYVRRSFYARGKVRNGSRSWPVKVSRATIHVEHMTKCTGCRRPTDNIRKGLCVKCYLAQWRGASTGEACECCSKSDKRVLMRRKFGEDMRTVCGDCFVLRGRRDLSIEQLRAEVYPPGDRRSDGRRRQDRRAPLERRERPSWMPEGDARQSLDRRVA